MIMEGIFAKRVMCRLLTRAEDSLWTLDLTPNLDGLPEWVKESWESGLFSMSADDDFGGLWVASPRYGLAVRAEPDNILIYHGEGQIGVLSDV